MKPAQPRVPVRWGFVLMCGLVVAAAAWAAFHFLSGPVSDDASFQKQAVDFAKRIFGH